MQKFAKLAVIAGFAALLAAPALADGKAAATVNGYKIPQSLLDDQIQNITSEQPGQQDSPELRKEVLNRMINIVLMAQESSKKGFDKKPLIQEKMKMAGNLVLAQALIKDYKMNHPISEDKIRAEYNKLRSQPASLQYDISGIVVKSQKEAKMIAAKLKKGANMRTLARRYTLDPGGKKNGGHMGWHGPAELARMGFTQVASALLSLKKGHISKPIPSPMGWYVIKVNKTREIPFDQVKESLVEQMQQRAVAKMAKNLRKHAKIEYAK